MTLDKVVLASDSSPQFLNFWPIAAKSWIKIFGIVPTLALISNRPVSQEVLAKLNQHGEVHYEISKCDAPIANQAKMFRWFLATKFKSAVTSIEDIDTIYLTKDYLENRLANYVPGKLLGIGNDVNQDDPSYRGKFPASNLTGTGYEFQNFFESSLHENFEDFLTRFKGLKIIDGREDPFNKPSEFSDESLIRALRTTQPEARVITIARDVDIKSAWMDRSWWPENGQIPQGVILANMPRPLFNNQKACKALITLHFKEDYPWIFPRRSPFWENPDSKVRLRIKKISYYKLRVRALIKNLLTKGAI